MLLGLFPRNRRSLDRSFRNSQEQIPLVYLGRIFRRGQGELFLGRLPFIWAHSAWFAINSLEDFGPLGPLFLPAQLE